jgi:hypothetical protein
MGNSIATHESDEYQMFADDTQYSYTVQLSMFLTNLFSGAPRSCTVTYISIAVTSWSRKLHTKQVNPLLLGQCEFWVGMRVIQFLSAFLCSFLLRYDLICKVRFPAHGVPVAYYHRYATRCDVVSSRIVLSASIVRASITMFCAPERLNMSRRWSDM